MRWPPAGIPRRPLVPDTFLLSGYVGAMALESLPCRPAPAAGRVLLRHSHADRGRHGRCRAGGGRHRADRGRPRARRARRSRTDYAGRRATMPAATSSAATASSTTPRSWPSRSLSRGASRVAILDVDFHHGNGTQQIFWNRDDVLYVSLHGDPGGIYPYYSGYASERGGDGGDGRQPEPSARPRNRWRRLSRRAGRRPRRHRRIRSRCAARRVARLRHLPRRSDLQPRAADR